MNKNEKYKNDYRKINYIRKELVFTKEQWNLISNYLFNNDISLKQLILNIIEKKNKQ